MELPFDGAISAYYKNDAPNDIRTAIKSADKDDILSSSYPHDNRMGRKAYEREMAALQIELVKLQSWVRETGPALQWSLKVVMPLAKAAPSGVSA